MRNPNWLVGFLLIIIGAIGGAMAEQTLQDILQRYGLIPIRSILFVVITAMFLVIFISHLISRVGKNIDQMKQECLTLFKDRYYCSFIEKNEERLIKMIQCINNAKKDIYIFSDLVDEAESQKPEHISYLKALASFFRRVGFVNSNCPIV